MGRDAPTADRRTVVRTLLAAGGTLGALSGATVASASQHQPYVTTYSTSDVTDRRAVLLGHFSNADRDTAEFGFEYGPDGSLSNRTTDVELGTYDVFSTAVYDLSPGTTYSWRATVESSDGLTDTGDVKTFTTLADAPGPDVRIDPATDVTATTATLNGRLESLDGADTVDVHFQYEWPWVTRNQTEPQTLSEPGAFSADVEGLTAGVEYSVRAFAEGSDGDSTRSLSSTFTTDG